MRLARLLILSVLLSVPAHAAELVWDAQTITSPLTVERSATQAGPYSMIATLPTGATSYILTPGAYGFYRVRNTAGPSNVVQFSADLFTGPVTTRLDALEANVTAMSSTIAVLPSTTQFNALAARVTALETIPIVTPPPPTPTSNLTIRQIDIDHIEVTCNGIGISTTGTGLQRVLTCKH